jgi:hypothetical protein
MQMKKNLVFLSMTLTAVSAFAESASPNSPCSQGSGLAAHEISKVEGAAGSVGNITEALDAKLGAGAEQKIYAAQMGFPVFNGADAFIGEKGDFTLISLASATRFGDSRAYNAPLTQFLYNTSRRVQVYGTIGGIVAAKSPGEKTQSAMGDLGVGARYLAHINKDNNFFVAGNFGVTQNFPGSSAVDKGLSSKGPVYSAGLSATKVVNDSLNVSGYYARNFSPDSKYHLFGVGAAVAVGSKGTVLAQTDFAYTDKSNYSCTAGLGYSHSVSKTTSLGVGITRTFCLKGENVVPATSVQFGVARTVNVLE